MELIEKAPPGESVILFPVSEAMVRANPHAAAWIGAIFEAMGIAYPWSDQSVRQEANAIAARFDRPLLDHA